MGEVLEFPIDRVKRTAGKDKTSHQTATILVFEGVQYSSYETDGAHIISCPLANPRN